MRTDSGFSQPAPAFQPGNLLFRGRSLRAGFLLRILCPGCLSFCWLSWMAGGSLAGTRYVSPAGRNDNPGTLESPWASPGYGSKQLPPGGTLVILPGRYLLENFYDDMITPPSGTPEEWTVIRGSDPAARPVLAGRNNLFSAIDLSGCRHVRVENLEITHDENEPFRCGITAWDPAESIRFENLYIHHLDEGAIDLRDINGLVASRCRMEYCGFGAMMGPAGAAGGWRNVLVEYSTLSWSGHYYQGGSGPSPYDRPDGFGIEPSAGPVELAWCELTGNRGDGLDSKADLTYAHHCVIANNSCDGLKLWGDRSLARDCLIYGRGNGDLSETPWASIVLGNSSRAVSMSLDHLTVDQDPGLHGAILYAQLDDGSPELSLTIRRCIFARADGAIDLGPAVKLIAENNLFFLHPDGVQVRAEGVEYLPADIQAGRLGRGNFYADPLFVLPANGPAGDYHLRPGSPAVDRVEPWTEKAMPDLDGISRPRGRASDLGAFESGHPRGDLDGDTFVHLNDLLILQLLLAENLAPGIPPCLYPECGDWDAGGSVTVADPLKLMRWLVDG